MVIIIEKVKHNICVHAVFSYKYVYMLHLYYFAQKFDQNLRIKIRTLISYANKANVRSMIFYLIFFFNWIFKQIM